MVLSDREVRFQIRPNWIYYFDTAERENSVLLFNKVSEHQERITQRKYEGPQEARRAMHLLGFPSEQDFENMVRSKMVLNCPVSFLDVKTLYLFLVLI